MKNIQQTEVKMKNIVLLRIDDRLLHGQVVVSWIPYLNVNEVLIIDNEYSEDEFMREIMKSSAPVNLSVHVLSVNDAAAFLTNKDEGKRILILARSVESVKELMESVKINTVNVGGLGAGPKRKRYYNSIHLSDDELNILKEFAKNNIKVEVKMLPNDKPIFIDGK